MCLFVFFHSHVAFVDSYAALLSEVRWLDVDGAF